MTIGSSTYYSVVRAVRHNTPGAGNEEADIRFSRYVLFRLLSYLKPHAAKMIAAFVLMLLVTSFALLIPYLIKQAIDVHIVAGDQQALLVISLVILGAYTGTFVFQALQRYFMAWVGQRVLATLRLELVTKLQILPLGYHTRNIAGVIVSRVIGDVAVINELLSQGLIQLVGDFILLLGTVWVMLALNVSLALLTFTVIPFMVMASIVFSKRARVRFRHTRRMVATMVGTFAETLTGMRVVQAFGQEDKMLRQFSEDNEASRTANVHSMKLAFTFLPIVEILSVLATALVLWFGAWSVIQDLGAITVGLIAAFLAYVTRFFQPIQELSQLFTTLQAAMAGGERIVEILDTPEEIADPADARPMPPIQGHIEFRNASFHYDENVAVLHDINLTVPAGDTIALVGPTGAGKTSIANLIPRFYDVAEGQVLIDGIDVRTVTQHSLRSQMGMVTQDPHLFTGTVADNIRFACPEASQAEVEQVSRQANAHDFIVELPAGYDTEIEEGGTNLSAGQRQLICIARAMLANPRILIMDEATASVDTVTESMIQGALDRLLAERTAIVIAHRLSTIRNADRIYVLDQGAIIEQGTHEELMAREGLYHLLHQKQYLDYRMVPGPAGAGLPDD